MRGGCVLYRKKLLNYTKNENFLLIKYKKVLQRLNGKNVRTYFYRCAQSLI